MRVVAGVLFMFWLQSAFCPFTIVGIWLPNWYCVLFYPHFLRRFKRSTQLTFKRQAVLSKSSFPQVQYQNIHSRLQSAFCSFNTNITGNEGSCWCHLGVKASRKFSFNFVIINTCKCTVNSLSPVTIGVLSIHSRRNMAAKLVVYVILSHTFSGDLKINTTYIYVHNFLCKNWLIQYDLRQLWCWWGGFTKIKFLVNLTCKVALYGQCW